MNTPRRAPDTQTSNAPHEEDKRAMSVIPPAAREGGVLDALLAGGIAGRAERVVVGFNWTYVEGPDGAGLCQTPARGSAGCRSLPAPGTWRGRALADLAAWRGAGPAAGATTPDGRRPVPGGADAVPG